MLNVVETFSGIGSQAKALKNIDAEFSILHTVEWDINAIIAYYLIHNDKEMNSYPDVSPEEKERFLKGFTFSQDGKKPMTKLQFNKLTEEIKNILYSAVKETRNLVSITDVSGSDIPSETDVLTYSFPCQDLSLCGFWHGKSTGISRDIQNRSGMLWQIERILMEIKEDGKRLPRFLLMENVPSIFSAHNKKDFDSWKENLSFLGYQNFTFILNSKDFGIPQKRRRAYMLSILSGDNMPLRKKLNEYFLQNSLDYTPNIRRVKPSKSLNELLKTDYVNEIYRQEAEAAQPNDTESRRKIFEENDLLYDGQEYYSGNINTITTKQDRNPNSGLVLFDSGRPGKSLWRYLTARETFLLMGFEEDDFDRIVCSGIKGIGGKNFFTDEKLYKFAGNSIVVNVLEEIFRQIIEIKEIMESEFKGK